MAAENRTDKFLEGLERIKRRFGAAFDGQKCPICAANGRIGTMRFRYSVVQQEPLADCVLMKCEVCKFISVHGLPISSEEFEVEVKERDGTWFTPHWKDGSDPSQIIVDRLTDLGYIEYEYRRSPSGMGN